MAVHSIQLACVLLHFRAPRKEVLGKADRDSALLKVKDLIGDIAINPFEEAIRSITEAKDLLILYNSIKALYERSLEMNPERSLIKEVTILLHKIITINYNFFGTLNLHAYDFNFVVVALCEFIGYSGKSPSAQAFIYLTLCLLQRFSLYPEFANDLNKNFDIKAKRFMDCCNGSYLDCYISFVRDLIVKYKAGLEFIGFGLLSILTNL